MNQCDHKFFIRMELRSLCMEEQNLNLEEQALNREGRYKAEGHQPNKLRLFPCAIGSSTR